MCVTNDFSTELEKNRKSLLISLESELVLSKEVASSLLDSIKSVTSQWESLLQTIQNHSTPNEQLVRELKEKYSQEVQYMFTEPIKADVVYLRHLVSVAEIFLGQLELNEQYIQQQRVGRKCTCEVC